MIKTVIKLRNGEVIVFDEDGEQMPAYQGNYRDVRGLVFSQAAPGTIFLHWLDTAAEPVRVPCSEW